MPPFVLITKSVPDLNRNAVSIFYQTVFNNNKMLRAFIVHIEQQDSKGDIHAYSVAYMIFRYHCPTLVINIS